MRKNKYDLSTPKGRFKAWLNAMLVDHLFTNYVRSNFHKIADGVYRSSQPTLGQLKRYMRRYGIKTVINLKGENRKKGAFLLEEEWCQKLGLNLVSVRLYSYAVPTPEVVRELKHLFENVEYPVLIHCKSGADRTSIAATLYRYFRQGVPVEKSDQMRFFPYGHMRYSGAGISDFYFEEFTRYNREHPGAELDLLEWTERVMDREEIKRRFVVHPWADFLYKRILRRE